MIKVKINSNDTKAFGKTVLELDNFDPKEDFGAFEQKYIEKYDPFYVYTKISSELIAHIHALEAAGFRYADFQYEVKLHIEHKINTTSFYPYNFEEVLEKEDLDKILEIVDHQKIDNRFTADPVMNPLLVKERTRGFILKSFKNKDEALFKLFNSSSGEIVAYKTHKVIDRSTAQVFMDGVDLRFGQENFDEINDIFHFNVLYDLGLKNVITYKSGKSHRDLNTGIHGSNYEIMDSLVVLRKVY
jgi:hypothetical protein